MFGGAAHAGGAGWGDARGGERGPVPSGHTRTPGRASPAGSRAVRGAGSGPGCAQRSAVESPQRHRSAPGSCQSAPGVIRGVCPCPHTGLQTHTHTHTATGPSVCSIRVVLIVKKGSYPLRRFPERMSSLELLLSSLYPKLSLHAPLRARAAPAYSRLSSCPAPLPIPLSRDSRFVSRGAAVPPVWFSK